MPLRFPTVFISWLSAFWAFSRPHTVIGTSVSVLSLYLIAILSYKTTLFRLDILGWMWLTCLCGNIYIVGLNQLEDIDIDRINKPQLPLAAGAFSLSMGRSIVGVTGLLAVLLAWWQGPFLLLTVGFSLGLGTAYSLPPVRLKRFSFWAAFCILTVRGVVVNLGLFLHVRAALGQSLAIPPQVWALTGFIWVFTLAIATFKDIPDLEGDRRYQIKTLTLQWGQQTVFNLSRWILTIAYLAMAIAGVFGLPGTHSLFLVSTHLLILAGFWWRSFGVDLQDKAAIARFYQLIWKLVFSRVSVVPHRLLVGITRFHIFSELPGEP
ncbi:homogentisate phytyltransferase [Neosynechococcus sphagnicola]|uniref:homogentisate phytyltransferase n=1 Tax=Neosynechococcus sphagnicola TaxID=1501145 RepID=UPI001EF9DF1D|nr:homogentisate phytyltransferase [Neosynechococcus sphagnicola]